MTWEMIKQFKSGNVTVNVSREDRNNGSRFSIQCGVMYDDDRMRPFIPVRSRQAAVGRIELQDVFERLNVCLDSAQSFIAKELQAIENKRVEYLIERDTQREQLRPTPRRKKND